MPLSHEDPHDIHLSRLLTKVSRNALHPPLLLLAFELLSAAYKTGFLFRLSSICQTLIRLGVLRALLALVCLLGLVLRLGRGPCLIRYGRSLLCVESRV